MKCPECSNDFWYVAPHQGERKGETWFLGWCKECGLAWSLNDHNMEVIY